MTSLDEAIEELRENGKQWEAFSTTGNCVVTAPPGSGKTKLTTVRLASDLRSRIPEPHGAACITYTNAAAGELLRRITELGAARRSNLVVGTVHSFVMSEILKPYAKLAGRPVATFPIGSKEELDALFARAVDDVYGRDQDPRSLKTTVKIRRAQLDYEPGNNARSADLALRWEELMVDSEIIDFDGVVKHAVELVESEAWIRRVLSARFPRLYLDEYQDLQPGFDRLVRALAFQEPADSLLFAVGDPDQSIMGFNGSRPELLAELAGEDGVESVRLETNYRSRDAIVQGARRVLGADWEIDAAGDGGEINLHECTNGNGIDHQLRRVAELIGEEVAADTPFHEIAVLCPAGYIAAEAASALSASGIPAFLRGDEYRETPVTTLIEGFAAWATQPRGSEGAQLGPLLSRWRRLMGLPKTLKVEKKLIELLLDHPEGEGGAGVFASQIAAFGLGGRLAKLGRSDEEQALDSMLEVLTVGDLVGLSVADLGKRAHSPGQVHVSTIHGGKGLEFDCVFVVGLDEGAFPHYLAETEGEINEARRSFYVSLTRARRTLHLMFSGFTVTKSGFRRSNGRCRFLDDIEENEASA